jgi:hypothetical protein
MCSLPGARACVVCPGNRPTQPLVPPPINTPDICTQCPPGKVLCNRLKIIVLCTSPWSKPLIPVPRPRYATSAVNCPPASGLVSRGMVQPTRLCGTGAFPTTDVPAAIKSRWPSAHARVLQYDFHASDGRAVASVEASTDALCSSASLQFCYSWCGDALDCSGTLLPRFKVLRSAHEGIALSIVDDVTYLSTDPCDESWVVLQLQQDCSPCGVDTFTLDGAPCSTLADPTSLCGSAGIVYTKTTDEDTGFTSYVETIG